MNVISQPLSGVELSLNETPAVLRLRLIPPSPLPRAAGFPAGADHAVARGGS